MSSFTRIALGDMAAELWLHSSSLMEMWSSEAAAPALLTRL